MYEKRSYRQDFNNELVWFNVCIGETDLMVGCDNDFQAETIRIVRKLRSQLNGYIKEHPEFLSSLVPLEYNNAEGIIEDMLNAGKIAGTGPFAAVAGAVSMHTGRYLMNFSKEVFVENGGDIFINSHKDRFIGIFAGKSPLSNKFNIKIRRDQFPLGICTSSATVGHSLSFGKADAVTVLSRDCALSDAVATGACNMIKGFNDISRALEWADSIESVIGAVAIMGDKIGAIGDIELST